jgi:hypothetical protein
VLGGERGAGLSTTRHILDTRAARKAESLHLALTIQGREVEGEERIFVALL